MSKISGSSLLVMKIILGSILMSLALYYINFPDDVLLDRFQIVEQFITEDENNFYNKLSIRRAEIFNKNECFGRYNLCENDLTKTGYFISEEGPCDNSWLGLWSGQYGIKSRDDFLFMPLIQDHIMKELSTIYYKNIYYYQLDQYIDHLLVTPTSLIAVMNLYGSLEILNFFHGKSKLDKNIQHDLKEFAKYKITTFDSYDYRRNNAIVNLLLEQKCFSNKM
ncbi:MAG: hypothetical protein WCP46_05020 [Alphaproteobacteria bacterium]